MRHIMTREFYIPTEASGRTEIQEMKEGDAVIYTYNTKQNQLGAMAFHGKAAKPDWHYSFRTADQRARKIAEYLENRKAYATRKAEYKAERSKPHTLKEGQILVCSWGYDQTNIDYYQVTRVIGPHTVEIREISARSGGEDGYMTAHCTAVKDAFKGDPMIKKANSTNCVRIASYACASPWDGKADRYSWYA